MPPRVVFSPKAARDLDRIEAYISRVRSPRIAETYVAAIYNRCKRIALAPHQGTLQRRGRAGLRITGFEHRVSIYFHLKDETVIILSVAYGGRRQGTGS